MKKSFIFSLLFSLLIPNIFAQQTMVYTNQDHLFEQGKAYFNQMKYTASYRDFEEYLNHNAGSNSAEVQEADYFLAANAFQLRQQNAYKLLNAHLYKYPYSPYFDNINFMLGTLAFENNDFKIALSYLDKVNDKHLTKRETTNLIFYKAYTNLQLKNEKVAQELFKTLKGMDTRYNLTATYYYAYTTYSLGNYSEALPEFLKLEQIPQYKNIVPYYIIQIYYSQKDFYKLNNRADRLLAENPNNKNNAEIYRIMGEISYNKRDFEKAISYLKKYETLSKKVLRNDLYILGLSYYQTQNYTNAIDYLSKTTTEKDEMAENAYLYIGNAYIKLNDLTNARMAYEAALQTNFNQSVREEALYNYAMTSYETTSAFGESIKSFEEFLKEFPNSKYRDQVYNYLASVYMTSKNYEAAYNSSMKIKNPNYKIMQARQYLLYQMGTEAFIQNDYQKAIQDFTLSLSNSTVGKYATESYFWRSESYYRLYKPKKSIVDLRSFFISNDVRSSLNFTIASYSMAYDYFSLKRYSEALNWFLKYINLEQNTSLTTYADALNRIGDCYFNARNFPSAELYYKKSASLSPNSGDYALFQSAYVAGLQKNYKSKINQLEDLISKYPNSEYVDNAMYEIGRSYIMLKDDANTIKAYQRLLSTHPNSDLARKAALEIGMVYFNESNYDQAITAYKSVIANYPGTEEAYTALQSLESVYIDKNDVASYLAYTKTLGMTMNVNTTSHEDSISYIAAERQYLKGNYPEAIKGLKSYMSTYCAGGRYCTTAQFYLADSYFRTNDKDDALSAYQALLLIPGNQYIHEATTRCAEITYDEKDYNTSMRYFEQLQNMAQNFEEKNAARLGILRCSYFNNDDSTTIKVADEILNDTKSGNDIKQEAMYHRAKAYLAINDSADAMPDLKTLSEDTRTEIGAESKYLLANLYFKEGNLKETEKEVLDFAKKNTPFQFWLARSFVLLADVYIKENNDFQAKQYLLSLQKNYTTKDQIQDLIQTRLDSISKRENKSVIQ